MADNRTYTIPIDVRYYDVMNQTNQSALEALMLVDRDYTTIPQYMRPLNGSVFEAFETTGDWTAAGTGTVATNTTVGEFQTGTQSIKLTTPTAGQESMTKTISWVSGGAAPARLRVSFYLHNAEPSDFTEFRCDISDGTNVAAKYFKASHVVTAIKPGWNIWDIYPADWSVGNGAPAWGTMLRFKFNLISAAAKIASISLDEVRINPSMRAGVMMTFDDGWDDVYNYAYAYMATKRVKGTFYVTSDYIGGGGGKITAAMLTTMYAAGWSIGGHSKDHTLLTTLSQADVTTNVAACKTVLDGLGFTRSSAHMSFPNGGTNETTRLGVVAAGIITARGYGSSNPSDMPDNNYNWPSSSTLDNSVTLAAAKALVDTAITTGRIVAFYGHRLAAAAAASTWAIADFQALVDYCLTFNMPWLTINDYYSAQSGAVNITR